MHKFTRLLALGALCGGLFGCGDTLKSIRETTSDWLGDNGKEVEETKPTELDKEFKSTLKVDELWSERAGKGTEKLYLKLIPAASGKRVYTADRDGRVLALDALKGDEIWTMRDPDRRISGGPGVGEDKVFVGTSDAEVVARDAATGKKLWVAKVSSEVLAPPRTADGLVIVRTGDGNIYALDATTGLEKWVYDRTIPVLTLRGTAPPAVHNGTVIAGFDSGRLVALELATGKQLWETQLAAPSGRSDLERLVDIDDEPIVKDETVYVGSFQGKVAAISIRDGSIEWTRDMSSYDNLAVDDEHVYITDERGVVWALKRADGAAVWRQKAFKYRKLTGPTHFQHYLVVGDFEGYLHWLDDATGTVVARTRVDKDRILTPPIDLDGSLLGYSSSGKITAYRAQ